MPKRIKAEIRRCPNLRMTGRYLRRLRTTACMSTKRVAEGTGLYRTQIRRWEELHKEEFELPPQRMQKLLDVLGASSL